ncbi:polysaccharide deacetylase family protein [Rhizobium lentis]|uniref:polysaccharide deacetylase family protein n=1 Tax=Rhizobium TaxID=379 RepID=UPI001615E28F|nr:MULTISPECIES: polysaccharide deacetylase family protein [Rhizobium]MBB3354927.1 peptidoglycan/xylan/chitin deacetylase (PgdA/CDA1 family) [Rhizobium sp. BK049]MBX5135855.1 polysaccharide deacetylase family protein [Rhizobium lentis]MBX5142616.1 polysaccharide deacetylase family protein [Rhizobium lentis]MBX5152674.1 polysaccharide deacetylase family protein [Rhizobium lentis]MBX5174881.1 polysaccharide deacetylase family protein [Rhizobium lentis]
MTGQLKRLAKRVAIGAGLEASSLIAAAGLMRQAGGRGVIFTLHHVRPHEPHAFAPNAHLEITPHFLDAALRRLTRDGYRFVRLDQLPALLAEPEGGRPFAAFTLDDGYINNMEHALPVFERHRAPFTVFVTKGFAERSHSIWWETLAVLLRRPKEIRFDFGNGSERLALASPRQQWDAFDRFAGYIHRFDEARAVATLDMLAREHGIEPTDIVRDLVMGPVQLQRLARRPLATLGAHTISHRALARLPEAEARIEMEVSADYVEALTGARPAAIAYPYGTPEAATAREEALAGRLGFSVAVTTQPGLPATGKTGYLPRMSLNGYYQKRRYVSALASGIPLKLMGR